MIRPDFFMPLRTDNGKHGGDAANLLALVRYATKRESWWVASYSDIAEALGGGRINAQKVGRWVRTLEQAGALLSKPLDASAGDQTKAYQVAESIAPDLQCSDVNGVDVQCSEMNDPRSEMNDPRSYLNDPPFKNEHSSSPSIELKEEEEVVERAQAREVALTGDTPQTANRSLRGTRLPDGWEPSEDVILAMHEQFPDLNLRHEHDKFSDYWRAKAGKDGVKRDWAATWRNWIRGAAERNGTAGVSPRRQSASDRAVSDIDALRDNPRLPANRRRHLEAVSDDRKGLPS